ncbi:hypothetical protein [Saccharicrinis fermentans]|uniref:Type VI secretion protein n=1 Tax=Saccharicrinis fermentans DSM 9555 = JCM 21142 TaxID=869213 RepID=W7YCP1_9BACT|nr:hypothetical protein [Saccharicrinis fermentans]GAF05238.1 hypothetical protein JCM21142_93965 [Saccharicrinis fermentans DSM 9555 = JCM 21142]
MAILDYEIGGNEVKIDGSESIAQIPDNRTLLIEKLTAEEPANPEAVEKLSTIEDVFAHFMPNIDIEFENEDGQPVTENMKFSNVGDFSVKNMTQQSKFMNNLSQQNNFYELLTKQLRSNKVLQRALEDPETKEAFINALVQLRKELED